MNKFLAFPDYFFLLSLLHCFLIYSNAGLSFILLLPDVFLLCYPQHFIFFTVIPERFFSLSSPGYDPGIHPSKHNAIHRKCWSIAVSVVQCRQPAAHLPCRSSPGFFLSLSSPGYDPGIHPSKHNAIHNPRHSIAVSGTPHKLSAAAVRPRRTPAVQVIPGVFLSLSSPGYDPGIHVEARRVRPA